MSELIRLQKYLVLFTINEYILLYNLITRIFSLLIRAPVPKFAILMQWVVARLGASLLKFHSPPE